MDESSALTYIKEVHEAKEFKFSSECLEILLKKNFMDAADYLLEQYYPKTQIDTEVIVRSVVSDIQRQQNYVLYRLLKAKNEKFRQFDDKVEEFPTRVVPMVYQAQSPDDLHFLVRLQEVFDDLDCNVTYEKRMHHEHMLENQHDDFQICERPMRVTTVDDRCRLLIRLDFDDF